MKILAENSAFVFYQEDNGLKVIKDKVPNSYLMNSRHQWELFLDLFGICEK